jgi:hypothetical protein
MKEKNLIKGKIVQAVGPIVDVEFKNQHLPELLTALRIDLSKNELNKRNNLTLQGELNNKVKMDKEQLESENNDHLSLLSKLDQDKYNVEHDKYFNNGWLNEEQINKDYLTCQSFNNSVQSNLISTMQKYSTNYRASLVPTIDNIKDFINEYYKLLNWDVVKFEQQAKEAAEQVIDQIDTMKKAILARAFRGELGTNDPADESAEEMLKRVL